MVKITVIYVYCILKFSNIECRNGHCYDGSSVIYDVEFDTLHILLHSALNVHILRRGDIKSLIQY